MLDLEVSATFEEDFSRSFLSEFAKARDIPIYKSKTKKKTPVDSRYIVWPDKNNSKSQIGYNEVNIDEKTDLEARLERVHKVLIPLSNQNPLSMSIYSIQGKSMEAIFESEVIELLGQQVKERSIITINDKEHPVLYMRYSTQPVRYTNISDGINVKVQPISADIEQYGKIADIYEKIVSANKMGRPVDILRNCSTDCRQNFETLGEGVTREELIAYFISQGGTLIDITNPKITDIDMSNVFYNPDMNIVWKMDNHAYSYIHAVMHLNQKVPEGVTADDIAGFIYPFKTDGKRIFTYTSMNNMDKVIAADTQMVSLALETLSGIGILDKSGQGRGAKYSIPEQYMPSA